MTTGQDWRVFVRFRNGLIGDLGEDTYWKGVIPGF